jgi:hypothetical protein
MIISTKRLLAAVTVVALSGSVVVVGLFASSVGLRAGAWSMPTSEQQSLEALVSGWYEREFGTQLGYEPFITSPRLFGWEDVDGDGVPEIMDRRPYGRSR